MWARQALVGSYSEVVLVCLSVTGLQLKYMGLRIVYIPFWHMPFMAPLRYCNEGLRRYGRLEIAFRDIEDGYLLNNGMKGNRKKVVTGDDLHLSDALC